MSDFRIDSHKLIYHPQRVAEWLQGKDIYPIYVEVGPSGSCNHRCIFCALDYMGYEPYRLPREIFAANVGGMAQNGVKSMMFAGEGEPLLNKNTPDFMNLAKAEGIDVSLTTNGVLFSGQVMEACLPVLSWVRFSLNAGSSATYDLVHRGRKGDFEVVLDNLRRAVEFKKERNLPTTIGVQLLLIPENQHEVLALAETAAGIGVDYFSVKPFSQHPMSTCRQDESYSYESLLKLEDELRSRYGSRLEIAFRRNAMLKLQHDKPYQRCLGLPFWAYIDARARVWACSAYLGNDQLLYGDLHEADFDGIWRGRRRQGVLEYVSKELNVKECREICRLDEINIYLQELKHPGPHVNFI